MYLPDRLCVPEWDERSNRINRSAIEACPGTNDYDQTQLFLRWYDPGDRLAAS